MKISENKDRVCQTLCDLLSDGIDIHRTVAAQALGHIGYHEAVPELVSALLDEDEDVRTDAAAALATLNDPRAKEQLMENLLGDPCPEVKLSAIEALTAMEHRDVIPWLRRMVKGRDEEMVWDEEEFIETGWDDWVDVQVKVIKSLAKFRDEESVPGIIEAIDDADAQDITDTVFSALGQLGEPGAEALSRYANAKDERKRRRAVSVLGTMSGAAAAKAVGKALHDEAREVRIAAGKALANRDAKDKRLEMLLLDKVADVRVIFIPICGKHHPSRLAAFLFEQTSSVQSAALQELLENPDIVRELELMGRLLEILEGPEAIPAGLAAQTLMAVAADDYEGEVLSKLDDPLCALDLRLGIIKALISSESENSLEALKALLSDDHRLVRIDAMTAIATRARAFENWPNVASEILLASLRGEVVVEPEIVETDEAVETDTGAAESSDPEAGDDSVTESIDAAQPMLSEDKSDKVTEDKVTEEVASPNSTMASILGAESPSVDAALSGEEKIELTDTDMEFLELTHRSPRKKKISSPDAVVAPHQDVRRFAARILGDFAYDDVAIGLALAMDEFDKELTVIAADSLAHIGEVLDEYPHETIDALLAKIDNTDNEIRFAVTRAYAKAGSRGAANLLKKCLKDDSSFVRTEAIRGLANCGVVDEAVEACLGDEIPIVRLTAAQALAPGAGPDMTRRLVNLCFEFEGYHVRPVARLLKGNNSELTRSLVLDVLKDKERNRYWKVAIEALEELGRPESNEALAA